jgi:hypothetical protein
MVILLAISSYLIIKTLFSALTGGLAIAVVVVFFGDNL